MYKTGCYIYQSWLSVSLNHAFNIYIYIIYFDKFRQFVNDTLIYYSILKSYEPSKCCNWFFCEFSHLEIFPFYLKKKLNKFVNYCPWNHYIIYIYISLGYACLRNFDIFNTSILRAAYIQKAANGSSTQPPARPLRIDECKRHSVFT